MKEVPFFTLEECNKIISLSSILEGKRREGDSKYRERVSPYITYKFWTIPRGNNTQWIFDRLNLGFEYYTGHKVVEELDKVILHEYVEGDGFAKHNDIYQEDQFFNIGVNLTDNYQGGEFILYDPDELVGEKAGELYGFHHTRFHEVKKITKGTRWSIVAFYFYKSAGLKVLF